MLQRLLGALFQILRVQQSFRCKRLDVLLVVLGKPAGLETARSTGDSSLTSDDREVGQAWYIA